MTRILALILALSFATAAHAAPIDNSDGFWSEWSDATFARAAREKKFVIMSLQSWWCRWCHVMNQETWSNAEVRGILKDKFIPVYVDQDSRPDISQRYERWAGPPEWWNKREGKLANIDVDYPDFPDGPAAFACTATFCSYPVTDPAAIPAQLDGLKRARRL
jgi:hypothetical protein